MTDQSDAGSVGIFSWRTNQMCYGQRRRKQGPDLHVASHGGLFVGLVVLIRAGVAAGVVRAAPERNRR
eukprot:2914700-Pyramimonas_sp.AAC.1